MITELAAMIHAKPDTIEALAGVDLPDHLDGATQRAQDPDVVITGPWADPELWRPS